MKVSELTGAALDWAVAKCEKIPNVDNPDVYNRLRGGYSPSIIWAQGGPIIERENVSLVQQSHEHGLWWAFHSGRHDLGERKHIQYATTPLVAAMRCYVASRLGDEVEIPEELK